jgi:hypothetical protein
MKRLPAIFAAAVLGAGGLFLAPAAANARYLPDTTPPPGPYSITVDDTANVDHAGTSAAWKVKITCKKHEAFYVGGRILQSRATLPAPYAAWQLEFYISAEGDATGTCTGKSQIVRLTYVVDATTPIVSPTGTLANIFLPLVPAAAADVAQAYLSTPTTADRGNPFYCSFIGEETPGADGEICEDATQIGPLLRLR